MIYLTSDQILTAVQRALEDNIAPELQTNYARVQLSSAIIAIREVLSRLENGDPCIGENERIEKSMASLAESAKSEILSLSAQLRGCVREAAALGDPREKNRYLKEGLWKMLKDAKGAEAARILQLVSEYMMATNAEDQKWVSLEAIASLN